MPSEEEFCKIAKQELSYTAWGRLRNPATQVPYTAGSEPALFLGRGYTGHEHLPWFGLINMNARLYEPALGRFLSPDPYVQMPDFTQNFNRYSYCLNNPLVYVDEDGEFIHLIIGAVVGGVMNVISNWKTIQQKGFWTGLGYFGVGAVAGALSAGVGAGISSALPVMGATSGGFAAGFWGTSAATTAATSFISGAAIGAGAGGAGGFISGFGNGLLGGQSFGKALGQGALYGLGGAASGALLGGMISGINAYRDGRNFWNGSKVINTEVLANANLPSVTQNNNMNCGPASSQANTGISQDAYREHLVKHYNYGAESPVNPADMNKSITDLTGRVVKPFAKELPTNITGAKQLSNLLNSGSRFMLSSGTGTTINHATALNKISVLTIQKVTGSTFDKIVYQVMDPAKGVFKNIGPRSMDFIWRIYP